MASPIDHKEVSFLESISALNYAENAVKSPLSLDDLGPDILYLICEQHYTDSEWRHCHSLRLVSRPMYEIAAPFLYRYLSLSQKRLEQLSTVGQYHDLLSKVQAYTRIVSLPPGGNLEAAIRLLSGCHQLKVLSFQGAKYDVPFPNDLHAALLKYWPHVRLEFRIVDFGRITRPHNFTQLQKLRTSASTIPPKNLDMLEVGIWPGDDDVVAPAQDLILAAKNLKTLGLMMFGTTERLSSEKGRFPPIRKFHFGANGGWPCRPGETDAIWDFSRLEDFRLKSDVLGSLQFHMLQGRLDSLRHITVDPSYKHFLTYSGLTAYVTTQLDTAATALLGDIIEDGPGQRFESIKAYCELTSFPISALARHELTLKTLKLLDLTEFYFNPFLRKMVTISLENLDLLQKSCPRLVEMTLGVDLSGSQEATAKYLDILCQFRNLTSLTLHTASLPEPTKSVNQLTSSHHYGYGMTEEFLRGRAIRERVSVWLTSYTIMHHLVRHKQGLRLGHLGLNIGHWSPGPIGQEDSHRHSRRVLFEWDEDGVVIYREEHWSGSDVIRQSRGEGELRFDAPRDGKMK